MSSYLHTLDPAKVSLVSGTLGIISTTMFYTMNTTINYLTMPTLFLGQPPGPGSQILSPQSYVAATNTPASPVPHLNRQWQEIYSRGHRVGPPSAIFSVVTLGTAAYFADDLWRRWILAAVALTAGVVMPYTLAVMLPTNNELHRRGEAITAGMDNKKEFRGQETSALVAKWVRMSKVRAGMALVATVLGVVGLLL